MSGTTTGYLDPWTTVSLTTGLLVAALCAIAGLRGHAPGRVTMGATVLLQVVLIGFVLRYLVVSLGGQSPVGPVWELWAYLVTIVMLPALGLLWARDEQTRWGVLVLAVAAFVAAVMCARAAQIWAGVGM
ncbi:MAG: hypothetical protein ACR2FV_13615 [Ornithinimicrobium sp.]|jgi:hypothetical protein|uniref:hypothetical protein n=1 Tax=Ornithinimicrobium sp. TaxID=1977084 RepID=UPI00185B721C|nr:hypothetical protein [Actinomycetota bacterium]